MAHSNRGSAVCVMAWLLCVAEAAIPLHSTCLKPGLEKTDQFIAFDVPVFYCIENLEPGSTYEIRLSYPGVEPSRWAIDLLEGSDDGSPLPGQVPSRMSGRKLLDVDKLTFVTSADGTVRVRAASGSGEADVPLDHVQVRITAGPRSVAAGGLNRAGTHYNVALDAVYLSVIPAAVFHLLPVAAVAVFLILLAGWLLRRELVPILAAAKASGVGASSNTKAH